MGVADLLHDAVRLSCHAAMMGSRKESCALLTTAALFTLCATWCTSVSEAAITYQSGPYSVVFQPDTLPTLQILRDEIVWSSPKSPGLSFVSVAELQQQVTQDGGTFSFKFTTKDECNDLEITENGTRDSHDPKTGVYPQVYFVGKLCGKVNFELTFQAVDVPDSSRTEPWTHLQFNLSLLNALNYNQLRLSYGSAADEHFYGFGAQYSQFDMKGRNLPLFLSEQGVGRGLEPLTIVLDALSPGAGISVQFRAGYTVKNE